MKKAIFGAVVFIFVIFAFFVGDGSANWSIRHGIYDGALEIVDVDWETEIVADQQVVNWSVEVKSNSGYHISGPQHVVKVSLVALEGEGRVAARSEGSIPSVRAKERATITGSFTTDKAFDNMKVHFIE